MAVEKSPVAWAITPLKKYAQFSGRAPRAEFWWFMLLCLIGYMVTYFMLIGSIGGMMVAGTEPNADILGALGVAGILFVLIWLALIIPTIAVQARRLHDTNRSGWWLGGFYLLYGLYFVMLFGSLGSAMVAGADGAAGPSAATGGMLIGTGILGIVLFVYMIVLIVFYCLPGTPGQNDYGADPYGAHENLEGVFS